jgi:hypothetical protein
VTIGSIALALTPHLCFDVEGLGRSGDTVRRDSDDVTAILLSNTDFTVSNVHNRDLLTLSTQVQHHSSSAYVP